MKDESDVQERIRLLLTEEYDKRVQRAEEKLPCSCLYNHRQPLDSRKRVSGEANDGYNRITNGSLPVVQTIGLCMYGSEDPEKWPGTICEDPVDALRCPPQAFTPRLTREKIKDEFEGQIRDIAWVKEHLPEAHALLWVLGSESIPETPKTTEELPPVQLSSFLRFLLRLMGLGKHRILPPAS